MSLKKQKRDEIKAFILFNIRNHPSDIVHITQQKYGLTRPSVLRYIHDMGKKDQIDIQGSTKNRKYSLKPIRSIGRVHQIEKSLAEDKVWRDEVLPLLKNTKSNLINICQYGFTEIFNNAIEHSEGTKITLKVIVWIDRIKIEISDDGVGIFNKIQKKYNLDDSMHAILELSKGKLTTEPESHTGEGIFFTSRMFDVFMIVSGKLGFGHMRNLDVLTDTGKNIKGTTVSMEISLFSERTTKSVFEKFASVDLGFDKTIVPVKLARYGNENLISRSQARRLLAHLDKFKNVILDFNDVPHIGRAFADEIFRVFAIAHPNTKITPMNHRISIKNLIQEIESGKTEETIK